MVLKQCGQEAMTFFPESLVTPASLSVSMFCWASMLKTNSLPSRRAGSPVHASAGPSNANFTPATCSSSEMGLVAAHPVYVVNVLDVDGALVHARTAVRARPQDLRVDDAVLFLGAHQGA